jgi:hypothetical protein
MTTLPPSQMQAARLTKVSRSCACVLASWHHRTMRIIISLAGSSTLITVAVQHTLRATPHRHPEARPERPALQGRCRRLLPHRLPSLRRRLQVQNSDHAQPRARGHHRCFRIQRRGLENWRPYRSPAFQARLQKLSRMPANAEGRGSLRPTVLQKCVPRRT